MTVVAVPERCSMRRAKALTGLGRAALEPLMADDGTRGYRSIPMAAVERIVGRAITLADWDKATLAISHEAMAGRVE